VAPFVNYVLIFDKLDLFAGGLLIAFLYHKRESYKKFLQRIFQPWVQLIMLSLCAIFITEVFPLFTTQHDFFYIYLYHSVTDVLFGYLLLSAVQPNSILRLENKVLVNLGKVSYGVYLMHTAVAQFVLMFFKRFIGHPNLYFIYDYIYPACALAATSAVAAVSYYFFESWFLRKKAQLQIASQKLWVKKTNSYNPSSANLAATPAALTLKKTSETSSETP
jgi:peptidoglycan/LPS O-acetylase OafA/YrhL